MGRPMSAKVLLAASVMAAAGLPKVVGAVQSGEGAAALEKALEGASSAESAAGMAQPEVGPAAQPTSGKETPAATPEAGPVPSPAPAEAQPASSRPAEAAAVPPVVEPVVTAAKISFNFKDTPLDLVVDFFSRESGLPVIFEAAVPAGAMTFVGAEAYSFEEALSILNLNLQRFGVRLRKDQQFLFLTTLENAKSRPGEVFTGEVPADRMPDEFVSLAMPLNNATAALVAEQIKPLIGPFGGVTAVPAQNMVIVTESAAQCRRIREIVQAIDQVRTVDSQFKLIPLKHAQAEAVVNALRGLMGERTRQVFIDKDGRQTVAQDVTVAGLSLQADTRTNSVIAVGSGARIKTAEELATLLDVPEGGRANETEMVTLGLSTLTAEDAAEKVKALFASVPGNRRPTVLPLSEAGKITIVGSQALLTQAVALLSQVDPGAAPTGAGGGAAVVESRAGVVPLTHVTPEQVEQILSRLLSQRQRQMVKTAPAPSGGGLVINGPESDVAAVRALIAGLDLPTQSDREVRLVKLSGDGASALKRAQELYAQTGAAAREPVTVSLDAEGNLATLIGARAGVIELERLITQVRSTTVLAARTFDVVSARPSEIAPRLARLAQAMSDDAGRIEVEPLDELQKVIVRAAPGQFEFIGELIERLERPTPGSRELRVVRLPSADAAGTLARARELFDLRVGQIAEAEKPRYEVTTKLDAASGSVLIGGMGEGMRLFAESLAQAQQLMPPERTTRVIDVQQAKAHDVLTPLKELLTSADSIDASRSVPEPTLRVIERTNSILVTAEEAQHQIIEQYVRKLDRLDVKEAPALKLLQLRTADASSIAAMLNEQYGKRTQSERAEKPVEVRADAATNTLIVSSHPELFDQIRTFVEDLNKERGGQAARQTVLFPLKVAKSADVAAAMDKLYPQPPMPVDRLGRPQPWAQQPKEVTVSAEAGSNALIIDAPAERIESLRALAEQLDRVELPPSSELRTFRVSGGNLGVIAQTLQGLASQGNLSSPAQPGKPSVQVVIQAEPKSGTLIVAGDEKTFASVEKLLTDLSAVPIERTLRTVPISNAKAAEIAEKATKLYDAQIAGVPELKPVEVSVDERGNALLVTADAASMTRFVSVIEELQRSAGPAREIRMLELKLAKSADVVKFLEDLAEGSESIGVRGGPEPVFESIEATNSVLVAAQSVQMPVIESLVRTLDAKSIGEKPPLRILKLKTSDAGNLAQVLQRTYDQRSAEQRGSRPVDIQADAATNTLIVSAHEEVMGEIQAIVAELNETQAVDAVGREIRIFPLKVARAEELAETIDQMFPQPPVPLDPRTRAPRADLAAPKEVVVRADRATNALIVDAPSKRMAGFEQIVKSLDQQKLAASVEVRGYRLTRADVNAVVGTLRELAAGGALGAGSAQTPVTVSAEPATKTVVVSGPAEVFKGVEGVIEKLDSAPARSATTLKMYPLAKARAERLQPLLSKLLATRVRELEPGRSEAEIASLLDVASDRSSNTLVISAPDAVQAIAEQLIKSLDSESSAAGANVVRVMPLGFAEAGAMAQTLTAAVSQLELPAGGPVSITAAPGSNALVLTGVEADLAKVEELIKPLDVRPMNAETLGVQTFALKHADAARISETVQKLLVDQQETDPRVLQLQLQLARQQRADLFKKPMIRVEAEPRTNSLIVSAPAATLELAKAVIERLDQPAGPSDRVAVTFTPAKAGAAGGGKRLAETVQKLVNATLPEGRGPLELMYEPTSASIIALGSGEQVASALKLLAEFDERAVELPRLDVRAFEVKRGDGGSLASALQAMLRDRGRWPASLRAAEEAGVNVAEPTVNADVGGGRLLVSAPEELMGVAGKLVEAMDAGAGEGVRVITLVNADATKLGESLKAAFVGEGVPPTVGVDEQSNSLIVRGTAAQMKTVEELAGKLDQAAVAGSRQIRMVPLDRSKVDAGLMARTLRELLEQQEGVKVEVISSDALLDRVGGEKEEDRTPPDDGGGSGGGGGGGKKQSRGDGAGAAASLIASAVLAGAIAHLEEPVAVAQPEKSVVVPIAAEQNSVTIAVDPKTNSLMVVGSPRLAERAAELARVLESQLPTEPVGVRVVTLPINADASALAGLVNQAVAQVGRAQPGKGGGFSGPVSVTPDPSGSAVIVLSNETDFETVGALISGVTTVSSSTALTMKVYALSSVSAARAQEALRDLLRPTPQGFQARRVRAVELTVPGADGKATTATIDPTLVRVTADPGGSNLIVTAPAASLPLIDSFLAVIDQSPTQGRQSIRRYALENARAGELSGVLQQLLDAQRDAMPGADLAQARIVPDRRSNSMYVTASEAQHAQLVEVLKTADASAEDANAALEIFTLQRATPSVVQQVIDQVVIGRDSAKRERIRVSAPQDSRLLLVRAGKEDLDAIRAIVQRVDVAETGGLPVRSVKLERADAEGTAGAIARFFAERAAVSSAAGGPVPNRVAIVGDRASGTLVVAAGDEDFAQVQSLAASFDSPATPANAQVKVVSLKNARVGDVQGTLDSIVYNMMEERRAMGPQAAAGDRVVAEYNERTNAVVLFGSEAGIASAERVIAALDQAPSAGAALAARAVVVERADLRTLKSAIERVMATPGWRPWRGPDPDGVAVELDTGRRALVLIGKEERVKQAEEYVKQLESVSGRGEQKIESITLEYARADRAAQSLRQFFAERSRAQGLPESSVSVIGSPDGNVVIASGDEANLTTLRDLVAQIDQPQQGKDRRVEVYVLKNALPGDIAGTLRSVFGRGGRADEQVVITPQPSTNGLIVSAPGGQFEEIEALLKQLDAPPTAESAKITTVPLVTARAAEVATALKQALPANVKVSITPVTRSNSLLLTGSDEAIALVTEQIAKLDAEPTRSLQEFKRFTLKHAMADDLSFTLRSLMRSRSGGVADGQPALDYNRDDNTLIVSATAEQMTQIATLIEQLDVPSASEQRTEFVRLEFADAAQTAKALEVFFGRFAPAAKTPGARNVTIVPDPAGNSLVISAAQSEWDGIRELIKKFDTADYAQGQDLQVFPLKFADAASLARAINEGLRAPLLEQVRQEQVRNQARRQGLGRATREEDFFEPTLLIEGEAIPTVSAEPQSNAVIVFAGKREMQRIKAIVDQLDQPGFAKLEDLRIIPLKVGKPTQVAQTIREFYLNETPGQRGGVLSKRGVMVMGDDTAGALIVRADAEQFAQVKAVAEALEKQGEAGRVQPHVLVLRGMPAARLRDTLLKTFTPTATQMGESLAIEVERGTNALVIASSDRLFEQIEKVVKELDGMNGPVGAGADAGGAAMRLGQSVFIIDVKHNAPAAVQEMLEELGLTKPQDPQKPGVVSEPITIVPMSTRSAIAVLASPGDGPAVVELVRAIDSEPNEPEQRVSVVALRMASAQSVVGIVRQMLNTEPGVNAPPIAAALAEQVRRLDLLRTGLDQSKVGVDLAKPVRLIADAESNSVVLVSSDANVRALTELIRTLDTLPIGDAVVIRLFPLENALAARVKSVVDELFRQGEALRRVPGTQRRGLPPTTTGQALAGEIASSVDERTNTLIVAGREEAVALVEVLIRDLDSAEASKWVEPQVIELRFADANALATKLREVLVQGVTTNPEAIGLQRQFGRLRMARGNGDGVGAAANGKTGDGKPAEGPELSKMIEADLFAPISGLVISAAPDLNALIVVGSPGNVAVVRELARTLDVESASAANAVRLFPLRFAAADRVQRVLADVFAQRERAGALQEADRLVITTDARTNALLVSTSPRSFAVVESLLKTLDSEQANFSVGLHVLPVEGTDVKLLAPKIQALMRERLAAATRQGSAPNATDAFSVEAEEANNLLIIASSDENFEVVKELVATLSGDAARLAGRDTQDLIQLTRAQAADVAVSVRELYIDKEAARRGEGAVDLVVNERLNALIVSGTQRDISEIRAIVARLDEAPVQAVRDVKRIELKSANALEMVNLVENVLAGRPVSGRVLGPRQATRVRFIRDELRGVLGEVKPEGLAMATEADVDGAIRDQVNLTPDLRSNSVIVNAPPQMLALIEELITDIDATAAGSRRIEKFRLQNADARQMADLLRDTFNLRQQGEALVLVPPRLTPGAPAADGVVAGEDTLSGTTVTPVPDERQQLAIAVDSRTNTLIVSGTPEYLELVGGVVQELDQIEANERTQAVYHLRNAKAKELETTLASYFTRENDRRRQVLGPGQVGAVSRVLEEEVTVVGDEKSNRLVISTSPRYMDTVMQIVEELDSSPPQVMIQVLLAEVTLDSEDAWGADLKVGPFGSDNYQAQSLAAGAGVATALGVGNLSVSSADFSLLIRALEAQGKLEVLSEPKVMVNNNTEASIQVGDDIAITTGVERTPQGGTVADVERRDVGIILNVTPSINADGFVRLDIKPEISTLSARTTQITQDFAAPVINKRTLDTNVTVKDGQSVVIGGLIQSTEERRKTKVPLLGDFPLVGELFKSYQTKTQKTELMVILTPRVVPGQTGGGMWSKSADQILQSELRKLEDPGRVNEYLERAKREFEELQRSGEPRSMGEDGFNGPASRVITSREASGAPAGDVMKAGGASDAGGAGTPNGGGGAGGSGVSGGADGGDPKPWDPSAGWPDTSGLTPSRAEPAPGRKSGDE